MERWGNDFVILSKESYPLDSPVKKFSYRFPITKSKPLTKVHFFIQNIFGKVPPYQVELQEDYRGMPRGRVLSSGSFLPRSSGWQEVELSEYIATENLTYHLVIYSESANLDNFISLPFLTVRDRRKESATLTSLEGKKWVVERDSAPIYLLEFKDGTFEGQVYREPFISEPIYGKSEVAESVLMLEPKTISSISFLVRKGALLKPAGDLVFSLQDALTGEILEEGVLIEARRVKVDFDWHSYSFKTPQTLKINSKYRFVLKAPQATAKSYYEVLGVSTDLQSPYVDNSFYGKNSFYSYPDPTEIGGWAEKTNQNLCFKALVLPPLLAARPLAPAGRRRKILLLILLLLLLLQLATLIYLSFFRLRPYEKEFIVKNKECLVCHKEMLAKLRLRVVHDPFLKKRCTDCHLEHAEQIRKEVRRLFEETRGKRWVKKVCGETFGISSKSPCGKVLGLELKLVKKGILLKTTFIDWYHPFGKPGLIMPQKQLCLTCHQKLLEQTKRGYQHSPFEVGKCSSCHDPHASDYLGILLADERDLCLSCHNLSKEYRLPLLHKPFAERVCLSCHHPHASNYYGILQDSQRNVCFSCHLKVAQQAKLPVQHVPFVRGKSCTECHKPHSAEVEMLLYEQLPSLCYRCHPSIRLEFLKISHHPVDISWTCLKCHHPHATLYPKLCIAKDNNLCFLCHSKKITPNSNRSIYEASSHGRLARRVGVGLCLNCHTPHGSDFPPLKIMRECDLCFICHDKYVYGRKYTIKTHPVDLPYYDERRKADLICSSTCHDPHGTRNFRMLVWVRDGLCILCHQPIELP